MGNPYKNSGETLGPNPEPSFAIQDWTAGLDPEKAAEKLLGEANDGDRRALYWVRRFTDYGVTNSMIRKIGRQFRQLNMTAQLIPVTAGKTFELRIQLPDKRQLTDEEFVHLLAMLIIRGELASRFKRCEFAECKMPYFLGNSKAKYCSDN